MSDDYSSRITAVTKKIQRKIPASQSRTISFSYDFHSNTYSLYNPHDYVIDFLHELKMDYVLSTLKSELPLPASPIHVRSTAYLVFFFFIPLSIALFVYYYNSFFSVDRGRKVWLHIMTYVMYILMMGFTSIIHFVYKKNVYFDRYHKREKVMRAIFVELNEDMYDNNDCVWTAGKYGLYFYGTLKNRKSRLRVI